MGNSWKNSEVEKRMIADWPKFRKFLLKLLGFGFLMLAWHLFKFVWRAGELDGVTYSLGYVFLISGMIFNNAAIRGKENPRRNNILSFVFMVPAGICIFYSLWSQLFGS